LILLPNIGRHDWTRTKYKLNSVECFTRFHRQFRNFIQQNSTNSPQNSSQINDQLFAGLVPLSGKSFPQENNAFTASAYFQQSPMLTIIKRRAPSGRSRFDIRYAFAPCAARNVEKEFHLIRTSLSDKLRRKYKLCVSRQI